MITIRWSDGRKTGIESDSTRLRDLLARPEWIVWVDLQSPDDAEFSLLKDPFDFHPLAMEDVRHERQRPKVEEYEDHLFLVAHEIDYSPSSRSRGLLATRQIAVFARQNRVVTVHLQPSQTICEVGERCSYRSSPLERGADFLVYALLDSLVDRYFPIIDQLNEQIDHLEERAVRNPRSRVLQDILEPRRTLIQLRKLAGPTREVINTLMTHDFPVIHSNTLPYLRDVSDHLIRIYEMADTMRELLAGALDAHLSTINNQLNLIMQRLTIVAMVFLPLTFLTGFFGMNFKAAPWMPEWDQGQIFWMVVSVMVVTAAGVIWWFHKKHLL